MELTPALKAKVEKAIQAALKDVKPRPAVDRLLVARVSGTQGWRSCAAEWTGPRPGQILYSRPT